MKVATCILILMLLAVAACATTTAIVSYTAPTFNALPGANCFASIDTLRDLKEIVLEGRRSGTLPWTVLARRPAVRGVAYTDTLRGIAEQFWDFRTTVYDSTGNKSCPDSLIGVNFIMTPWKTSGLQAQ